MISPTLIQIMLGTVIIGAVCGMLGSILHIRRNSLLGDCISHSMIPGIAFGLLIFALFKPDLNNESYKLIYILGVLSGAIGVFGVYIIQKYTTLKNDAALSIILSVFFGLGLLLFSLIEQIPNTFIPSVETFFFGSASALLKRDIYLNYIFGILVLAVLVIIYRPLFLISFDSIYAKLIGVRVKLYDLIYYFLLLIICALAIQTVGVLLILSLLIIPAASMSFWTKSFLFIFWGSSIIGALSCVIGVLISSLISNIPSGPVIALTTSLFFFTGFFLAPENGLFWRYIKQIQFNKKIFRDHLLRYWFEHLESIYGKMEDHTFMKDYLLDFNKICSFEYLKKPKKVEKMLLELVSRRLITKRGKNLYALTLKGILEAEQIIHQHRLWELFLIEYADIAPGLIDRSADRIEHILDPEIVRTLELTLQKRVSSSIIKSPHSI